uniref:C6H2-type domain-containing protein n=1 Tax=Oryza meridionalis TaxID=40149 RepID=A0A0E0EZR3_9ORYZ
MEKGGAESSIACARCGKPASLQCPKCAQLKLPREGAAFCTQDCFKEAWSSHKSVHIKLDALTLQQTPEGWQYCLKKGRTRTLQLPRFDWTGPLRPYPISKMRVVPDKIEKPDWALDGTPKIEPDSDLQKRVEIKTPEQIERMRETCRIAREVLDAAARIIKPGITTDEIDRVVHEETVARGLKEYDMLTLLSLVSRKLEDGDIVNVDVTVYYKGVHGDLNETYFVGNVDEASKQLVRCTYECLDKAIAIVKPGVRFREVGEIINRHASMSGLSVVKSYCGHGIGELFHCAPNIPHYSRVWHDRLWPDEWTAVTADGKRSAQFEHTLLVTETGVEVLTARLPSSPDVFPWLKP